MKSDILYVSFDITKYNGVQVFYKNRIVDTMNLVINRERGINVILYDNYTAINEYIVYFDSDKLENLFLDELFFIIEEINNVKVTSRLTSSKKITSESEILEDIKKRMEEN